MVHNSNVRQPSDLDQLAETRFAPLSAAEIKLLGAASKGEIAYCGPTDQDNDPNSDPASSDNWGSERSIRAELVRWLCVNGAAKDRVDPRGIRVHAARITGKLDLSFVVVPFFLGLLRCCLSDDLDLGFIEIPSISLSGSCLPSLFADHATVKGNMLLRGLRSKGKVHLLSAHIGGSLVCDGGMFHNRAQPGVPESGIALEARYAKVAGSVLLGSGFAADGMVVISSVDIGGCLDCGGGKFQNPAVVNVGRSGIALKADSAKVAGSVLLGSGFAADGMVVMSSVDIGGCLDCSGGTFQNPAVVNVARSGTALNADGAKVGRAVLLRDGFAAKGQVRLFGADIGGPLECDGGKFQNPAVAGVPESGTALIAEGARVAGGVNLRDGFAAEGQVWLLGTQIGGNLSCSGGKFLNPAVAGVAESGIALTADGVKVTGNVLLRDGFLAEGLVWLSSAEIGGNLECDGGKFHGPAVANVTDSGRALIAQGAKIAGNVGLRDGFAAEGLVWLFSARIGGNLSCSGGKFRNPAMANVAESGTALNAEGAKVARAVNLGDGFAAEGQVRLFSAQIEGNLECQLGTFESLNLTNASAGAILDDENSWPAFGKLFLDGFAYGRIAGGSVDAAKRLEWLARQASFRRNPYRQLAKVLRETGDDRGSRRVCVEMERRTWEQRGWIARPFSYMLRGVIGYGYFSMRALWWLSALVLFGSLIYQRGYDAGSIVPTSKDVYDGFAAHKPVPPYYESFHALPYSMENSFPLVKFGFQDKWAPGPDAQGTARQADGPISRFLSSIASPRFLLWFRWLQICVGWILTTLFVGGVTGVIRRD